MRTFRRELHSRRYDKKLVNEVCPKVIECAKAISVACATKEILAFVNENSI